MKPVNKSACSLQHFTLPCISPPIARLKVVFHVAMTLTDYDSIRSLVTSLEYTLGDF